MRFLGLICIGSGGFLAWHNIAEAEAATRSSQEIGEILNLLTSRQVPVSEDGAMPIETVDSVTYIGNLIIPSEQIQLPVAGDYSFEQMYKTPTRYSGSYYTDDLVICAHNYRSHFDPLRTISLGQEIILKTVDGQTIRYIISNHEVIEPTEVEKVFKDQGVDGDWDLTLFTCTPTGLARVLVRCVRIK